MLNKTAVRLFNQLEQARTQIGVIKEREIVRLLSAAGRVTFGKDAQSLIRFHDLLLVLPGFSARAKRVTTGRKAVEHF